MVNVGMSGCHMLPRWPSLVPWLLTHGTSFDWVIHKCLVCLGSTKIIKLLKKPWVPKNCLAQIVLTHLFGLTFSSDSLVKKPWYLVFTAKCHWMFIHSFWHKNLARKRIRKNYVDMIKIYQYVLTITMMIHICSMYWIFINIYTAP